MKVKVTNIDWCIEEEDLLDEINPDLFPNDESYMKAVERKSAEIKSKLPTEVEVEVEAMDDELVADAISDKVGWLMYTFNYEVV